MRRLFDLLERGVVALEQIASALEVIQTVVVDAIEEEQRRAAEKDGPVTLRRPIFEGS